MNSPKSKPHRSECLVRPNRPQQPMSGNSSTASTIVLDLEAPTKEGLRDLVCRVQALAELVEVCVGGWPFVCVCLC